MAAFLSLLTAMVPVLAHGNPHRPSIVPVAPEDLPPVLAVEVHATAIAPIVRRALCPDEVRCVFGGGGGAGGSVERRFAEGYGFALGYDAWFFETSGVYELPVLQLLRASIRYVLFMRNIFHLALEAGLGAVAFGDSFRVSAAGGAVHFSTTGELEITEHIAFTMGLVMRGFSTSGFLAGDETRRLLGDGLNLGLGIQFGILITDP